MKFITLPVLVFSLVVCLPPPTARFGNHPFHLAWRHRKVPLHTGGGLLGNVFSFSGTTPFPRLDDCALPSVPGLFSRLDGRRVVGRVTDSLILHLGVRQGFLSPKVDVQGGQRRVDSGECRFIVQSLSDFPAQNPAKIDVGLDTDDHIAGCSATFRMALAKKNRAKGTQS